MQCLEDARSQRDRISSVCKMQPREKGFGSKKKRMLGLNGGECDFLSLRILHAYLRKIPRWFLSLEQRNYS